MTALGDFSAGDVLTAADLNAIGTWQSYNPSVTNAAGTWNPAEYCQINDLVILRGKLTFTTPPTGNVYVTVPTTRSDPDYRWGLHNSICDYFDVSTGLHYHGFVGFQPAGVLQFVNMPVTATVNATTPFTWAVGDHLEFSMIYKVA